ncbi:hypothetical protein STRTUCAR8_06400 [Streptomyces turgidiscabies Car8]|uniref:Uncharacterized protein n=1 Tax=Streptomyces turgidiscabies (strain Car8) TaxID=698760 RepID=L7F3C5_STRT8|nr:hypothetical protein STRTUCAR8_06400 [Streptomyces turgidiscabies Car8]GAQ70534.1 hypothetical protein T45_02269 [Streptomyces turgidiscabies]
MDPGRPYGCQGLGRSPCGDGHSAFDSHDLAALQKHRAAITDEPVPLVAVSRNGVSCSGHQAAYGPEELLAAWRRA